ncbi:hypothetical protein DID77_04720 [Candidatus Marinamargulisbacteria bacterium SCGC AG-439-L15]|nr:hypothetical protein DID77_04720 [Candidatus Marinamargulisbacteria bacterium SCGC AG-439-L15]
MTIWISIISCIIISLSSLSYALTLQDMVMIEEAKQKAKAYQEQSGRNYGQQFENRSSQRYQPSPYQRQDDRRYPNQGARQQNDFTRQVYQNAQNNPGLSPKQQAELYYQQQQRQYLQQQQQKFLQGQR